MAYKLLDMAQRRWRRLNGAHLLPLVRAGVVFVDVNENDLFDANEPGVDGVIVELLDEFGSPVLDDSLDPVRFRSTPAS